MAQQPKHIAANQVDVTITRQPNIGSVVKKGNDMFHVLMPRVSNGIVIFNYQICHKTCKNECDEATVFINVKGKRLLDKIETAITPDGDGKNDVLDFPEVDWVKYPDNKIDIYNRWGQRVFIAEPYKRDWRGQNTEGADLSAGDYFFILYLSFGEGKILVGSAYWQR
jgi:gliding motility-associated-like protein